MKFLTTRKQRIKSAARAFVASFSNLFVLDMSQQIEVEGNCTPVLKNDGRVLNLDFAIPDAFTEKTGLLATIFVRSGSDFVRITTSVRKKDGERAVGTPLDRSQPAYRYALEGRSYVGYAIIFGRQFITRYDPVRDASGQVTGILFVGQDVSDEAGVGVAAAMAWRLALGYGVVQLVFNLLAGRLTDPMQAGFGLFSLVFIWVITYTLMRRYVIEPITLGHLAAQRLAGGDLTTQVHVSDGGEIGQLLLAMNGICVGLTGLVRNVRQAAAMVTDGSREIAEGNIDLANRTEQQAGEVNAAASAIHELTMTVSQSAEKANQANTLVVAVAGLSTSGGKVVGQVVDTMGQIQASAHRINDIIGLMDGIAFQTNILALNAAVEAARAGDQGRGFAVVAAEVRSLAQRSSVAAKEIKTLIDTSVNTTNAGSDLVDKARVAMTQITESVQEVVGFIDNIALTSNEQRLGIEDVSRNVHQIDQMTQQNSALVEQSAAAAMKMRDQANALTAAVATFKT